MTRAQSPDGGLSIAEWQKKARSLQVAWREHLQLPRGFAAPTYEGPDVGEATLSDYCLTSKDGEAGQNFLTKDIFLEVDRAIKGHEPGAVIQETRLKRNMLSSQPLCFNAFGELSSPARQEYATRVLRRLWPNLVGFVRSIRYEHNPHRGPYGLIGTNSAFDVFVEVDLPEDRGLGFIAIEVKYHEDMKEPPLKLEMTDPMKGAARRERLDRAARWVGSSVEALRDAGVDQVWLDHALALAMLNDEVQREHAEHDGVACLPTYADGTFAILYPNGNSAVPSAVNRYRDLIKDDAKVTGSVDVLTLDRYLNACAQEGDADWVDLVRARYLEPTGV
jgi:hypothetical protein